MRANAIAYSLDGRYVVSGGEDRTVIVWGVQRGEQIQQTTARDEVTTVHFMPDGKAIVFDDDDEISI